MAKLVDAPSSGGGVRKDVLVRIRFRAQIYCLLFCLVNLMCITCIFVSKTNFLFRIYRNDEVSNKYYIHLPRMIAERVNKLIYSIAESSDRMAFNELVEMYYAGLVSFSATITKDRQLAEEVVEDILVKMWENRRTLTTIKNFSHYMYTAAKYASISAIKNKKPYLPEEMGDDFLLHPDTPETALISKEDLQIITDTINTLPPKCRLIFRLIKEDGMKYDDVAQLLGISIKTVENQMTIAFKRLFSTLQKQFPERFQTISRRNVQ